MYSYYFKPYTVNELRRSKTEKPRQPRKPTPKQRVMKLVKLYRQEELKLFNEQQKNNIII